jgi:hypothetical protein
MLRKRPIGRLRKRISNRTYSLFDWVRAGQHEAYRVKTPGDLAGLVVPDVEDAPDPIPQEISLRQFDLATELQGIVLNRVAVVFSLKLMKLKHWNLYGLLFTSLPDHSPCLVHHKVVCLVFFFFIVLGN